MNFVSIWQPPGNCKNCFAEHFFWGKKAGLFNQLSQELPIKWTEGFDEKLSTDLVNTTIHVISQRYLPSSLFPWVTLEKILKVYMTDFFFICSIKSPQCTDKYSKKDFSLAIFLPRVLMCQKRQISLPVGYKTARPKTGDWERLWRQFRTPSLAKNRFLRRFLIFS